MSKLDYYTFIFLCLFLLVAFSSCKDKGGAGFLQKTDSLTEIDFFNDPNLRVDPGGVVIATFLEHPNSSVEQKDTGVLGRDVIPLTYSLTTNNTFCWVDEDRDAKHLMTLNDINGIEIIRVLANGDCVTEVIEPGEYDMTLHHDGRTENTFTIHLERQDNKVQSIKTLKQ